MPVAIKPSIGGASKQGVSRLSQLEHCLTNINLMRAIISGVLRCEEYCLQHCYTYDPQGEVIVICYNPYVRKRGVRTANEIATMVSGRVIHGTVVLFNPSETKIIANTRSLSF